jgi:DNA polymerase-3 subunit epsilon
MSREIVLDTETTGLEPRHGHRLVEIACLELHDLLPTGRHFHCYINPMRDIDPEAQRIHGLSRDRLRNEPTFDHPSVSQAFLSFIADSPLVAHNAAFDRAFVNAELSLAGHPETLEGRWIDTLALAKRRYPDKRNSLDALCKRFNISLAERELHGALVDARLLASVYLELHGGRERSLDLGVLPTFTTAPAPERQAYGPRPRHLPPRLTAADIAAHAAFLANEMNPEPIWVHFAA